MKQNPGRLFLWLLLSVTILFAQEPYKWSVTASKHDVVVNEAVVLHYTCRFNDDGSLYTIEFKPPETTDSYRLYILSENERIRGGRRTNEYRFLFFPMRAGTQHIDFTAMMRHTTKASIENTVIGRDNVEDIEFSDTQVALPAVELQVAPAAVGLVGRFAFDMQLDKKEVNAFEPIHLTLTVEGEGNFDQFVPFVIDLPGVQVFTEAPQKRYGLSEYGFRGKWIQKFALVAEKEFRLDKFELAYFDIDDRRVKRLGSEAETIAVTKPAQREELLDSDQEKGSSWQWSWTYFNYLLTFLTGWIAGRWLRKKPSEKIRDESLIGRIKRSDNVKALAMTLVLSADERFAPLIAKLEKNPDAANLVQAKREALELIDNEEEWDIPVLKKSPLGRMLQIFTLLVVQITKMVMALLNGVIKFISGLAGKR